MNPIPELCESPVSCTIGLPEGFRMHDFLEFHGRDPMAVAERVEQAGFAKGVSWQGYAATLKIRFDEDAATALLFLDGPPDKEDAGILQAMVRRMLGLTQPVEEFEATYCTHPELGTLISRHRGLRVPLAASPFEALTWAITGQQISLKAAISLRRKLIQVAGVKHAGGLFCYPDAACIGALSLADLRAAGFSRTKAQTLIDVSRLVEEARLPLDAWSREPPPAAEIREALLSVRGIGPWTVSYALLRGFGWLDGSLHGDAGVRRGLQLLFEGEDKITEERAQRWLADFSPWRALVAAHLWAFAAEAGGG